MECFLLDTKFYHFIGQPDIFLYLCNKLANINQVWSLESFNFHQVLFIGDKILPFYLSILQKSNL